jgi:hypothetical protein
MKYVYINRIIFYQKVGVVFYKSLKLYFLTLIFGISSFSSEILDMKDEKVVFLKNGNEIIINKLCIDGYVFLYYKQLKNDGLIQFFTTDFKGNKIPLECEREK